MLLHSRPYNRLAEWIYALMRLAAGAFMMSHGLPKLMKLLDGAPYKFADPLGLGVFTSLLLAVFAEVFCAALLAMGLFTRLASIPLIVIMAVAAFVVHGDDPFGKKEMALLYLLIYLFIFAKGGGKLSIDRWLKRA